MLVMSSTLPFGPDHVPRKREWYERIPGWLRFGVIREYVYIYFIHGLRKVTLEKKLDDWVMEGFSW